METRNIVILLFDGVEILDFAGPYEVFSVVSEEIQKDCFTVSTVAQKSGKIATRSNLSVNPDYDFTNCPNPDILLIPGGPGTRSEIYNQDLVQWIQKTGEKSKLILSVCTGSLLLGKAGILDGLKATTHHLCIDLFKEVVPHVEVCEGQRWVDNGHVITSAGISAGIDMSLYVVGKLFGVDSARKTADVMEYDWTDKP